MTQEGGYSYEIDLWALGITLYELVTGYFPFGDDKDDVYELIGKIKTQETKFNQDFDNSAGIKPFIMMLLNKNPKNRYIGEKIGHYELMLKEGWLQDMNFVSF